MSGNTPKLLCIDGPEEDIFPVTITVRNLNGAEASIEFDCIPRTVTQWAAEGDKIRAEVEARIKAEKDKKSKTKAKKKADTTEPEDDADDVAEPVQLESIVTERISTDAGLALRVAKGWSLKDPFNQASLVKLEDKFPGAIKSLHQAYTRKINGEREGN